MLQLLCLWINWSLKLFFLNWSYFFFPRSNHKIKKYKSVFISKDEIFSFSFSPFKYFKVKVMGLVKFFDPWENILALWQYFKMILFQITDLTKQTWPYLTNVTSPSLIQAREHQKPPSATLKLLVFEIVKCDARWHIS